MLACMCLPHTRSHPNATVVCKPRSAWRTTSSPGYDPAACKGRSLAFSKLFDPHCCGLWAWCIHTREGKGDEQGSGSAWGGAGGPNTVRKSYDIWHALLSDVRHDLISTYHPGKLLVDETVPRRVLLGYTIW